MSRGSIWLWFVAVLIYAFLYIPLAIVVMYSFNDSRLNAEWVGFTLSWYQALFNNTEMLTAAPLYLMTHRARTGCLRLAQCESRDTQCLATHPDAAPIRARHLRRTARRLADRYRR